MNPETLKMIALGITLATEASAGVIEAINARCIVEQCVAEGRDPSPAEWDAINAVTDALHQRVQGKHG